MKEEQKSDPSLMNEVQDDNEYVIHLKESQ